MKAKELMLGDWVQTTDRVTRVESIGPHSVLCEGIVGWLDQLEVHPVPLNMELLAELLVMNGFKANLRIAKLCNNLYYDCYTSKLYANDGGGDMPVLCKINYVHELQHALRLCGIDKEIVL